MRNRGMASIFDAIEPPDRVPQGVMITLAAVILHAAVASATWAAPEIKVGYLPATHDALLFIALDLHLFDASKVKVLPKSYDNSVQILSDLKSGAIDIGIPGIATPATEIGGKAPLTIIGGAASKSAALVVRKTLGDAMTTVAKPEDRLALLRGRKVGAVRGSTGLAVFRQGLVRAKLGEHDVEVREFSKPSEIISELYLGNLDAGLLWSPHMTLAEDKQLRIGIWMDEILPNHVCCRQVGRDAYLNAPGNNGAVVAYIVGLLKADRVLLNAQSDPALKARVVKAVQQYMTMLTERQLEVELFGQAPRTTVSPDLNAEGILAYLDAMKAADLMRADQYANVRDKIRPEFMRKAFIELGCSPEVAKVCVDRPARECACLKK